MLLGKKLLVLGGAYQHLKIVDTAKRMGIITYVTDYLDENRSPAKKIADYSLMYDIMDIDGIVNFCKEEKIDGVIGPYLDSAQKPYSEICEKMGYYCFANREQFNIFCNKQLFSNYLVENNMDIISEYNDKDISDNLEDNEIEFPVIVKPVDSRGSRGQIICEKTDELNNAIEKAKEESKTNECVIQKYMGQKNDIEMEYIVINGEPILLSIGDRVVGSPGSGIETLNTASILPSVFEKFYRENINSKVVSMIKNLGLKNSPVFLQGFIDGDTVRFYDPGLRFMGDDRHLIWKKQKIDIPQMLILFAINGKFYDDNNFSENDFILKNSGLLIYPDIKPGKIKRINGLSQIKKNDKILTFSTAYNEGDLIGNYGDLRQRFGEFVIIGKDKYDINKTVNWIYNTLHVYDEDGNEMLFEKYKFK